MVIHSEGRYRTLWIITPFERTINVGRPRRTRRVLIASKKSADGTIATFFTQQKATLSTETMSAAGRLFVEAVVSQYANSLNIQENIHSIYTVDPIIQTGPHTSIILNPQTFLAYAVPLIRASIVSCDYAIVYQCSTVTLEEYTKEGAGWLAAPSGRVNIIPMSRKAASSTSACAVNMNVSGSQISEALYKSFSTPVSEELRHFLEGKTFNSVAECFNYLNTNYLSKCIVGKTKVLIADENSIAKCLEKHFSLNTALSHLLMSEEKREELDSAVELALGVRNNGSSLFWSTRRKKIGPMFFKGNSAYDTDGFLFDCSTSDGFVDALRKGTILPKLFLSFTIISFLGGFSCVGGMRQLSYLPKMFEVAKNWFAPFISPEQIKHGWGYRLKPSTEVEPVSLWTPSSAREVLDRFSQVSLREGTNNFEYFRRFGLV